MLQLHFNHITFWSFPLKTTLVKFAATVLFGLGSISLAHASTTITFDDLPTATTEAEIADGYSGFNWDNFYILTPTSSIYSSSGFVNGLVSATNVAFNAWAEPAAFSSTSAFTFVSAYVTKGWETGVTHFDGYVGNTLTYSVDVSSTKDAPTLATFNWVGVTKVVVSDANKTGQSVVDNITVAAVPEPETYAMLLAGLGMVGAVARRRKQK